MIDLARLYIAQGWAVIPIPRWDDPCWEHPTNQHHPIEKRGKIPLKKDWEKLRIKDGEVNRYFKKNNNIGIILGEPSNCTVDIDLDCAEAIELAALILPPTLTFGRKSKPVSHYLYRSQVPVTKKWTAPSNGKRVTLLELRSNGGQTVLPGSVHPSGEKIEWTDSYVEVAEADPELLQSSCQIIANMILAQRGIKLEQPKQPKKKPTNTQKFTNYDQAVLAYCADHELPDRCPYCLRKDAWRVRGQRWTCHYSAHPAGFGGPGRDCFVGDAVDILAYELGCSRGAALRKEGYL